MASAKFQLKLINLQSNMLNFAYMLTSNRDAAYDLLQDTTIKVLDNEDKYADNTNFKNWVFAIMRNIFMNDYRTAHTVATTENTDGKHAFRLSQESVIEELEESYGANELSQAINDITDEYRIPYSMHVTGYKVHEIAEFTGLSLATVKQRIAIAQSKVRAHFAGTL